MATRYNMIAILTNGKVKHSDEFSNWLSAVAWMREQVKPTMLINGLMTKSILHSVAYVITETDKHDVLIDKTVSHYSLNEVVEITA